MAPDIRMQKYISTDSESDDSSDGNVSNGDGETSKDDLRRTLVSIEKSMRIQLHIGGEYSDWTPQEAFRELVQNWYGLLKRPLFTSLASNVLSLSNVSKQA